MACLLGRVQTSLALLSLHFAIATPKINFCHLPVGTVRVRCNEGVPCGTPSLGFIAELWREANGYGSLTSTTYPLLYTYHGYLYLVTLLEEALGKLLQVVGGDAVEGLLIVLVALIVSCDAALEQASPV